MPRATWTAPTYLNFNGSDALPLQTTFTSLKSYLKTLDNVVGCGLYKNTTQSLTTATSTAITFGASDVEDFDTHSFHSTTTNTSRITIPNSLGGVYQISAGARFDANATGVRYISVFLNGLAIALSMAPNNGTISGSGCSIYTAVKLIPGDYIELNAYQNSGGALNVGAVGATGKQTYLSVVYAGGV